MAHPARIFCLLAILLCLLVAVPSVSLAAPSIIYVVTKTADTNDGTCDADCSLREAVAAANANAGADNITFNIPAIDGGCTAPNVCILRLGSQITISQGITIDGGLNPARITLSGDTDNNGTGDVRIFSLSGSFTFTFQNLTFTKGSDTFAGAIVTSINQTVNVTNSTFIQNRSTTFTGGAIKTDSPLFITNSTFIGNTATTDGGAVYNEAGSITVNNSTFSGNTAANGGAIGSIGNATTVTNSTFSGNTATTNGGGIFVNGISNTLTLRNSTLSGNSAAGSGGGVRYQGNATFNFANTIIANSPSGGDCSGIGTIAVNTASIIEDGSCATPMIGDPNLGSLADNGGPTQTFALLAGSPALGAGDDPTCAAAPVSGFDQRGITRPAVDCDIGAYEREGSQAGNGIVVTQSADTDDGVCGFVYCTLREAINLSNTGFGFNSVSFNIPVSNPGCIAANNCTIVLASALPIITHDVQFVGFSNAGDISISGNDTVRIFEVANNITVYLVGLTLMHGNCPSCDGGGVFNNGMLTVMFSTLHDNSANAGGAIVSVGNLTVIDSTIVNNTAPNGGGIYSLATTTIINTTISGNSGIDGGGVVNDTGTLHLKNSIIANSVTGENCRNLGGTVATNLNNLIEPNSSCGTPLLTSDPQLGALAENGGPTQTMALGSNSPAIDTGDATTCADVLTVGGFDQRGNPRDDLQCDIGAFEFEFTDGHFVTKSDFSFGPLYTFGPTLAGVTSGSAYNNTLTLNRELSAPVNSPPANALPITWDATTPGSGYSFIFTLCYDPLVLTGQNENTLHVYHDNGSSWDDLGGTLDDTTYLPYHCVTASTALNSLSPLALAPFAPTAVNVSDFSGRLTQKGIVQLKWHTLSESFISGFNVYRRTGKQSWVKISPHLLNAKQPGSPSGAKYSFKDKTVKPNKKYRYKIEVLYSDSHSEWTRVVKVKTP